MQISTSIYRQKDYGGPGQVVATISLVLSIRTRGVPAA
jgi:hypothetical protein